MTEFPVAPDRVDPPYRDGERSAVEAWLEFHRATLLTKCAGLTPEQTRAIVLSARQELRVVSLPEEIYWGKAITDERYLAVSHR